MNNHLLIFYINCYREKISSAIRNCPSNLYIYVYIKADLVKMITVNSRSLLMREFFPVSLA